MRDLHTLFWIAKYVYRVREPEELIERGVFDRAEYNMFRRCEDFLWSVRCNMHFLCGRAEERLSFDIQREIAVRLGYTEHPGLQDVERFMKHYFLTAKHVGDLTAILCAALEERQAKPAPVLSRVIARLRPARSRRTLTETDDFIIDNNRINLARPNVFKRDPVNLIRLFYLAQKHNLAIHPDAMRDADALAQADRRRGARRQGGQPAVPGNPDLEERGRNRAAAHERGRRARRIHPRLRPHRGDDAVQHVPPLYGGRASVALHRRAQRDRARRQSAMLRVASELMRTIQPEHRTVLYVALFLHDIAKGRIEDHSIAGARIARRLCPRLGFNAAETELVAWLVEVHLVMSTVAQSRDLSDRKTIENFAAVVQSLERMKLLTILTTADIRAVGPGVWNGWKAQLLRTLYYETEPVLTGGFSEVNRAERVAAAKAEFRAAIGDWPAEALDAYIARHYPAYWLKVDLPHKLAHARFVRASEAAGKRLATSVGFDAARGVTELTVYAPDHPWLLSIIAGACALAGANIVDAQIYTTTDGLALDTIAISREFELDEDEARRAARIGDAIEKAVRGQIKLPEVVPKRAPPKGRLKAFAIEPEVTINNQWSQRYTVVEVTGLDRPGLLYELTTTLSKLNLNIASAHVATFGERVVDVFYVTDLLGAKITTPTRQAAIKRPLHRAVHLARRARPSRRGRLRRSDLVLLCRHGRACPGHPRHCPA